MVMMNGDHEIDGAPHFLNVPTSVLPDFGRLLVVSSRIERTVYQLAELLDIPRLTNGRTWPLRKDCLAIEKALAPSVIAASPVRPEWAQQVQSWVGRVPDAMDDHRNRLAHSHYFSLYDGEGGWVAARSNRHNDPRHYLQYGGSDIRQATADLVDLSNEGTQLLGDALSWRQENGYPSLLKG